MPDEYSYAEWAEFVDRWLNDLTNKCLYCGGHSTECASAAFINSPCGA